MLRVNHLSVSITHPQPQSHKLEGLAIKFNASVIDRSFFARLLQQIGKPRPLDWQFDMKPNPAGFPLSLVAAKNEFASLLRLLPCRHLKVAAGDRQETVFSG